MNMMLTISGYSNDLLLALTSLERLDAVRKLGSKSVADDFFMQLGIGAIFILTILFFVINSKRVRQEKKTSTKLFDEYSKKSGLSSREKKVLFDIASKAGLKRNESVFTLVTAFDRGVDLTKKKYLYDRDTDEYRGLKRTIKSLREQLGFTKEASFSRGTPNKSLQLTSRDVPTGKKVNITRRNSERGRDIEAIVVENTEDELSLKMDTSIKITFGEPWIVRYHQGSAIWEFETSVISYDGGLLILDHSETVRFINRRRFMRVPVRMTAFIASFPFEKTSNRYDPDEEYSNDRAVTDPDEETATIWGPPEFFPAVVTELAGPGLRIESNFETNVGERVLVVFNIGQNVKSGHVKRGTEMSNFDIAEDIGMVRQVTETAKGFSIAVELTGLNDANINKLICAANITSMHTTKNNEHASVNNKNNNPSSTRVRS